MGQGEKNTARDSIRNSICRNSLFGDGICTDCERQSECNTLVDEALGLVSYLANKRKSDPGNNEF